MQPTRNFFREAPYKIAKSLVFYQIEISQRILLRRLMSNCSARGAMWSESSGLIVIPGNNAERHNVEPWRTYPPNPPPCVYDVLLPSPGNGHPSPSDPSQLGIAVWYARSVLHGATYEPTECRLVCACIPLTTYTWLSITGVHRCAC